MTLTADLTGQRILVTGASSEGFGAHFARLLAKSGAHVIVTARRLPALEALVEEIRSTGGSAEAIRMDVADLASVREGMAAAGAIDTCINNAGVAVTKRALDQTEDDYDFVMGINLKGAWNVATEAARGMRERGGGNIINTASITGFQTAAGTGPYAVSKAGVLHMTRQLAMELARFNIRVNALAPGYFLTDINRDQLSGEAGEPLRKRIAMRRYGELPDLDGPLLLLASDASRFMTGSILTVDGGHLVHSL
ncbi:MAG: 2-deoxy-D-gluconate 3-dehydrogenase [Sphingomonadales bacterium RIFCSPHIGHO2_01_FULL_65_20]|jgi:NAD(P)-dependent dehydrogenase (short-subunit alcohol dehydrogenase family)|uniref:SDR family NAD(P)-dependent oxidoreductase n=1 Tax=Blastomonas TaxID=150203 RepID=UPI00082F65DB|nr:SDR family oxidoreductase [Sphingomonas ursincola]MBA4780946.1 SDR family oxidoreductase [Blastomonas sp.]MBY0619795.1 SDR family oxidoreductase [Sphingomonas ursincola]MCH2239061.1 SDR family oxidoreductase [Blastomonas sp.]OHC96525.1 MAG: 2-deoxy-D-gluconate 3-dehydrogenase [Sphingomonadales bacterium RIFCSPHIGHO2_01_FULL_65_20]